MLLCDPAQTKAEPLISLLLISPMPSLRAFWQRVGFGDLTLQEMIAR